MATFEQIAQVYAEQNWLAKASAQQLSVAGRRFDKWLEATNEPPSRETFIAFLHYDAEGRSVTSVNSRRGNLLTIWKWAFAQKLVETPAPTDVRPMPEFEEMPTAWTLDELSQILDACQFGQRKDDWQAGHWRALVLTIYDTSTRISALLKCQRGSLVVPHLHVPAQNQKQRRYTLHELSEQTIAEFDALPRTPMLFPWPWHKREIWRAFREIILKAGLDCSRRDLFHKLRRTSYTQVACKHGISVAGKHAGHRGDLSRRYLDPRFLTDLHEVVKSLPRPGSSQPVSPEAQ